MVIICWLIGHRLFRGRGPLCTPCAWCRVETESFRAQVRAALEALRAEIAGKADATIAKLFGEDAR